MASGNLYIVSAPSGAGKTSLVAALKERLKDLVISVSHTTRAKRPGEQDGVNYHFVSQDQFKKLMASGEFLESAEVFGNYYGTSKAWVEDNLSAGRDIILEIDWQGAKQVRLSFPEVRTIFILPPSLETLNSRLVSRGQDSSEIIAKRLSQAKNEISHYSDFDYLVINDNFEEALEELKAIFLANRLVIQRAQQNHESLIEELLS